MRCLEAMRLATTESRRRKLATKTVEWELLDKVGKQLANAAIERLESSRDGESNVSAPRTPHRPTLRRRAGRGRDRRLSMLPNPESLFDAREYSNGARLACSLLIRELESEPADASFTGRLTELRQTCREGLHPVWRMLAEEAPLFEELGYYPLISAPATGGEHDYSWLLSLDLDPCDGRALSEFLSQGMPATLPAGSQLALKRVAENSGRLEHARGREWLRARLADEPALAELESPWSLLHGVLMEAAGCRGALLVLESAAAWKGDDRVEAVCRSHLALARLRRGRIDVWRECHSASGDGGLARAQRLEAWNRIDSADQSLDAATLELARSELEQAGSDATPTALEAISWRLLDLETQLTITTEHHQRLRELIPESATDVEIARRIISDGDYELDIEWLETHMPGLVEAALLMLARDDRMPSRIRLRASDMLKDADGGAEVIDQSTEIALNVGIGDVSKLVPLLMGAEAAEEAHPFEVLLVYHLHSATSDSRLEDWLGAARTRALGNILNERPRTTMTDLAITLLRLLEGARTEHDSRENVPKAILRLDKKGILAYKQCRFAFKEGGKGFVARKEFENLRQSIEEAALDDLEQGLFETLLDTMRLNRAAHLLRADPGDEEMRDLLFTVFDRPDPRHSFIEEARRLVLAHEIALPPVLQWHQANMPRSVWTKICKAAVDASDGDRRSAGTQLLEVADSGFFEFDVKRSLYRRALIHFAHAGVWAEAVRLLEEHAEMASVVTRKFQLYLTVSCEASQGSHRAATRRLLSFSEISEEIEIFDEDGNLRIETRKAPSLEVLQSLLSYPASHPDPLPEMPFTGRVRAALNDAGKRGRLSIDDLHRRFENCLRERQYLEVNDLANRAAKKGKVIEAMHWMERAVRRASIEDAQKVHAAYIVFFQRYQDKVTVRQRRHLRSLGLKILVLIDTNLLIDALTDEIGERLELAPETRLNLLGRGTFHRSVLDLHKDGRIDLHVIPAIANHEFRVDGNLVRKMFSDVLVDSEHLEEVIKPKELDSMRGAVLAEFNDWNKQTLLDSDLREVVKAEVETFLTSREEIYREITTAKFNRNSTAARTKVADSDSIYPEANDRKLMLSAAEYSDSALRDVGGVVVATRDSDFIMVARALEEKLGFGVVWNTKTLNAWLPER